MQVQDIAVEPTVKVRVRRGMALVDNVKQHGDLWIVRSSNGNQSYTVNLDNVNGETCSCPDWKEHGFGHICKHIYAVAIVVAQS